MEITKSNKAKSIFWHIIYSLSIIIVWGLALLSPHEFPILGSIISFIYTVIGTFIYLSIHSYSKSYIIFILPIIYFTSYLIISNNLYFGTIFLDCMFYNVICLLLVLLFHSVIDKYKYESLFYFANFIICYSFFLFKPIENNFNQVSKSEFEIIKKDSINIRSFELIKTKDFIETKKRPSIFITWSTNCAPCKKLKKVIDANRDELSLYVNIIYVYIPSANSKLTPEELNMKSTYYTDDKGNIKNILGVSSFPLILLTDSNEFIIWKKVGFLSNEYYQILENIIKNI